MMSVFTEELMIGEDSLDCLQVLPKKRSKLNNKLDIKLKLQVIHALDSGHSKSEVAKDYSVTQRTVSNIYKQKELLVQKYTLQQNLLKKALHARIEQSLLEWFILETKRGHSITEDTCLLKIREVIDTIDKELFDSICLNGWLRDFQIKHKITTFTSNIKSTLETKEEWMKLLSDFNPLDVYIGGIFALSHCLDTESYLKGQRSEEYISIMFAVNTIGTDKQQLLVLGKDANNLKSTHLKSLPVKYYLSQTATPQINYSLLHNYLENWNRILKYAKKNILLILDLPDNILNKLNFDHIKVLTMRNLNYVTQISEKLINSLKYNYRKIQISKRQKNEEYSQTQITYYIHMIAMAWHNIPARYIELLCSPQADGCLYFNLNDEINGDHSLSHWYVVKNKLIDSDQCSDLLDKFIYCDAKLEATNWRLEDDIPSTNILHIDFDRSPEKSYDIDAFLAMRRLVSYLQEKNAATVLKHAKCLENHIEYTVMSQMHVVDKNKLD